MFKDYKSILRKFGIRKFKINEDSTIDVLESFHLHDDDISKIPLKIRKIYGSFSISNSCLGSLIGSPKFVEGDYYCDSNMLTSLKYCPEYVGENFNCANNLLVDLKYSPKYVGGTFNCSKNKLESLSGFPDEVKGSDIILSNNKLRDLYGLPKFYEGRIWTSGNPVYCIIKLIPKHKRLEFIKWMNEFSAIQGPYLIEMRLEEALYYIKEKVDKLPKFRNYKVV